MHSLLSKLFEKRGITDVKELDEEELKVFQSWDKILSKESLTIDDIKAFCQSQIETIENKWADLNLDQSKKAEMIPYHTVYKLLLNAIKSPQVIREQVEEQLNNLIK